jgi:Type IX secretion system protein PorV
MRPSRSSLVALVALSTFATPSAAQDRELDEGGAFLLIPVGARAAASGQASVAIGGSSESAFWNPAGLALMQSSEIGVHHANTFASNNTALAGYLRASRFGVIGISAYLVDFGSQEVVLGPGLPVGRISPKNIELLASYATEIVTRFTLGLNYKLIQFRQDCSGNCTLFPTFVGTTQAVDFGAQYAVGAEERLRFGLAVQNLGFKLQINNRDQADPLPTRVQAGVAYRIDLPRPRGVEQALDVLLMFDVRNRWGTYTNPDARIGVDLGYQDVVRLRAGYAFLQSEAGGPSIGVGFRVGRLSLDFARVFFAQSNFDEPTYISIRAAL